MSKQNLERSLFRWVHFKLGINLFAQFSILLHFFATVNPREYSLYYTGFMTHLISLTQSVSTFCLTCVMLVWFPGNANDSTVVSNHLLQCQMLVPKFFKWFFRIPDCFKDVGDNLVKLTKTRLNILMTYLCLYT